LYGDSAIVTENSIIMLSNWILIQRRAHWLRGRCISPIRRGVSMELWALYRWSG
jgi:hypothetical protein